MGGVSSFLVSMARLEFSRVHVYYKLTLNVTTILFTSKMWYLDCLVTFTHVLKANHLKSSNALRVIALDVLEFVDPSDTKKKKDISRKTNSNKKKEGKEQEIWINKEKNEIECLAKFRVKVEKQKGKGKKKVEGRS